MSTFLASGGMPAVGCETLRRMRSTPTIVTTTLLGVTSLLVACIPPEERVICHCSPIWTDAGHFDPAEPLERYSRFFHQDQFRTLIPDSRAYFLQDPTDGPGSISISDTHSRELSPGDAVTLWWAFFADPSKCEGGLDEQGTLCGLSDLEAPLLGSPALGYAGPRALGGAIVDSRGEATFAALRTSVVGEASLPQSNFTIGDGLVDLFGSEVHLILRTHGPALPDGAAQLQLGGFDGFCEPGEPNEGMCKYTQEAFLPAIPVE